MTKSSMSKIEANDEIDGPIVSEVGRSPSTLSQAVAAPARVLPGTPRLATTGEYPEPRSRPTDAAHAHLCPGAHPGSALSRSVAIRRRRSGIRPGEGG